MKANTSDPRVALANSVTKKSPKNRMDRSLIEKKTKLERQYGQFFTDDSKAPEWKPSFRFEDPSMLDVIESETVYFSGNLSHP